MLKSVITISVAGVVLTGCATMNGQTASVAGDHQVMRRLDPGFAVRGKRLKDSQWIGKMQETGIRNFGWRRPTHD